MNNWKTLELILNYWEKIQNLNETADKMNAETLNMQKIYKHF